MCSCFDAFTQSNEAPDHTSQPTAPARHTGRPTMSRRHYALTVNSASSASAFQLSDRFLVHGQGRTRHGLGLAQKPFLVLPPSASDGELGSAVLSALAAYQSLVPDPTDLKALSKPILKAAGVSSLRRFQQASLHCSIVFLPEVIEVRASHADSRGHLYSDHHLDIPLDSSGELIGSTVRRVFGSCTSDFPNARNA